MVDATKIRPQIAVVVQAANTARSRVGLTPEGAKNTSQIADWIADWAQKGQVALNLGGLPAGYVSWDGWVTKGKALTAGLDAQNQTKAGVALDALSETIANIPKHAVSDVQKGFKATGEVVGGAASGLVGGFLGKAWWVVLIAGAGVAAWFLFQGKLAKTALGK